MTRFLNRSVLYSVTVLFCLLVLSCASVIASEKSIIVAMPSDVPTVDPHVSATTWTVTIVNHIFDPLVQREPEDMTTGSRLAESWEIVDEVTYIFYLRQGVTFHNGDPFSSADVVFSFDRMRKPGFESMGNHVNSLIESVEALDEYTVKITLQEPYAPFMQRMASFYMVPQGYIEAVGDEEFARNPIGTGPYHFKEWVHGEYISFKANEDYWGGVPEVKEVFFRTIPERSTRVAALLSGEVDLVSDLAPDDIQVIERNPQAKIVTKSDFGFFFFVINSRAGAPFDDVRVRQALTYAINWDEVLFLFDGLAERVPFPALPNDFGYGDYVDDLQDYLPYYDPAKAKALLAEAGYADGFSMLVQAPSVHYAFGSELAQAVAAQLTKVGIDAEVRLYEWGHYYSDLYLGNKLEFGLFSMGNPLFDPDHLFSTHFRPGRWYGPAEGSAELIAMFEKGRAIVDPTERADVYRDVMKYMLENVPYLFTHSVNKIYGLSERLEWTPRTDNRIFINEVGWSN